ncbi:hypothetical protein CPB86DRAFT_814882 [Serendipita vermifera]|nr:hypothetical protein CPB86DRAFT_814882 [Serendipita vermifera]
MNSAGEARYDSAVDDDGRGLTRYVERAEGTRHDATASDQWDSAHYSVPVSAGRSESLVSPNGHNFGLQAAQNHFSLSPSSAYPTVPLSLTNNPNQYRIYPHGPPAPIHPEINTQWRQHSSNSSHSFPQTQVHSNFQFANAGTITQAEEVIQELDSNYVSSQYENYSSSSSLDQNVPHSIGMIVSSENPNHLPILDNKFDGNDNTRLPSPQNGFSEFSICFNDGVNSDTHATTTFAVNGSQYIGAPTRTRARSLKLEEIPFAARPWFLPPGAPTESHRKALRNVGRIPKQVYELFYREISGKIFCNYCRGGRSALQNRLEEHVNVHVGFRPYICSTCKKAYSRKENHNRDHPFEPELNFG